eukprot:Nk52_evm9s355 gene=Nk52_evmTU9s355
MKFENSQCYCAEGDNQRAGKGGSSASSYASRLKQLGQMAKEGAKWSKAAAEKAASVSVPFIRKQAQAAAPHLKNAKEAAGPMIKNAAEASKPYIIAASKAASEKAKTASHSAADSLTTASKSLSLGIASRTTSTIRSIGKYGLLALFVYGLGTSLPEVLMKKSATWKESSVPHQREDPPSLLLNTNSHSNQDAALPHTTSTGARERNEARFDQMEKRRPNGANGGWLSANIMLSADSFRNSLCNEGDERLPNRKEIAIVKNLGNTILYALRRSP